MSTYLRFPQPDDDPPGYSPFERLAVEQYLHTRPAAGLMLPAFSSPERAEDEWKLLESRAELRVDEISPDEARALIEPRPSADEIRARERMEISAALVWAMAALGLAATAAHALVGWLR